MAEDEASLYLQATPMCVWAPRGDTPKVGCDPGRGKTSFYGTLDLRTGREVVMQSGSMTAEVSAKHLEQVLAAYPDVPILLLWDRAPWHRGERIREVLAANPRLEVWQFPVAAPDLNPQEHVWKAARKAVSHNHRDAKLAELSKRFEVHLRQTSFVTTFLEHRGFYTVCPRSN